jgi:hypothetical protein
MPDREIPVSAFFASEEPSAGRAPHIITALDAELLGSLVRINGAKLGVWHQAAPYDENDNYQPYREDVPLSAWNLAYNQGELLELAGYTSTLVGGNETLIVDSACDEKALLEAEESLGEGAYADLPDFPKLLQKIGWVVVPIGEEKNFALVLTSESKKSYLDLLQHWCHEKGRTFYTLTNGTIRRWPAPEDSRLNLAFEQGGLFLAKMAHFGISAEEAHANLGELLKRFAAQSESEPQA